MSISTWQNSTSSHHSSRRPGVCCRSSRRRGWDRSSSVAQSNPAPGVLSAASDRRDTYSPGLVSAGTTCTGHDGMPADTGGLHSLASWKEQLNTRGCDRSKIKALDGAELVLKSWTYFPHIFPQEKCPEPSNPALSVPHETFRAVTPQKQTAHKNSKRVHYI